MNKYIAIFTLAALCARAAFAADNLTPPANTLVQPATDGIFEAFKTHPLVGLGDDHGLAQGMEFYAALIRDPRFAREVGNVVVEFAAGGRQDVLDRYVAGATVPYTELRTVWTDTVGWIPPAGYLGFAQFLAAVRATNKTLPPNKRIRLWAGEPPIDWSTATRGQTLSAMNLRDSRPAELIAQNILGKDRKALVIYGSLHFGGGEWLRGRVEAQHRGAFFIVLPYNDQLSRAACAPLLESAAKVWPAPALAAPGRGGIPDTALLECAKLGSSGVGSFVLTPGSAAPAPNADSGSTRQSVTIVTAPITNNARPWAVDGDAVLFYGPLEKLTKGPYLPDYVLDTSLRREMARRGQVGAPPLVRFPRDLVLRKADYKVDLDVPDFAEKIAAMFTQYDRNGDGIIGAEEYVDPIPR